MAFTFIGASPNPLPLPSGLALDSRRFAGYSAIPVEQRPRAPSKLKVRYTITDVEGRIKNETVVLDPLPADCTVRDLQALLHEHMSLSPRHPIVLRYHGQPLEVVGTGVKGEEHMDRPLAYYAIKDHSELTVVVKPAMSLSEARALARPDGQLARVRIMSHKLSTALSIDELTPEMKIGDLYLRLKEILQASPIFLVAGPEPPVAIGARPMVPLVLAEPLFDGTAQLDARVGDQLVSPDGAGGGKAKGGGNLKRISDGAIGAIAETDLWKVQITGPDERVPERWGPEKDGSPGPFRWKKPSLQYGGAVLEDESLLTSHGLLENEILYLDFAAPWDPPPEKPGDQKGGKKKK